MAKFERFDVDLDGGRNNSSRWNVWLRRFNLFIEANAVTRDRKQIATLLNEAGSDIEEIYEAKRDTSVNKADEKYAEISKLITDHFAPQKNLNLAKLKFREISQHEGENIKSFHVRLKTAAVPCEFTDAPGEILLQMIQGSNDKRVKLKASQETITLENLLKYIESLEFCTEEANIQHYKKEQGACKLESTYKLDFKKLNHNNEPETSKTCFNCGYSYPHTPNDACPAKNKKCGSCGQIFAKLCKNKKSRAFKPSDNNAEKANQVYRKEANNAKLKHGVEKQFSDSYNLFSVSKSSVPCPRIEVNILGSNIEVGIDTQASINALSKETFENMAIKPELTYDDSLVYSFDGKKPLKTLGKFKETVYANNMSVKAEFIVFDGVRDNLLSFKTSTELKLVKLMYSANNLNDEFHKSIILKYPDLFSGKIGCLKDRKIKIHIKPDAKSVIQKERKVPYHLKDLIETTIDEMIRDDIIEPVSGVPTPFISCFLAVPKPNNPKEVRITLDARCINKVIERERHNIPTLDDLKVKLNGAKYISKADVRGSYHQLEINEESRFITVFRTSRGLMRYKRLIQGLNCSSEIFQHELEMVLDGLKGVMNLVDDIFIWGNTAEEHDENLNALCERLLSKGLTLNAAKCVFKQEELEFFGMKFSKDGISLTDDKIKALKEAKLPKTQSELRSFLGFANFCSESIPQLALNASLLWKLTHKNHPKNIIWTDETINRFNLVKDAVLTTALSYFEVNWDTVLEVDASPDGVGAVLYQTEPGKPLNKHIVSFWSKAFSNVEQRYSQVEKEALGVVLACEKFRIYLVGKKFKLLTDNKAVEIIYKNPKSNPPARIRRFNLRLMDLEFEIQHKPGIENMADYLSRHPLHVDETDRQTFLAEQYIYFICEQNAPRAIRVEQLMEATLQDKTLKAVIKAIKSDSFGNDPLLKSYRKFRNELSIYQDKLVLRGSRIVIPQIYWSEMIKIAHEGHLGIVKTKQLIRDRVWFPGIDAMVENEISQCISCQLVNNAGYRPEPLKSSVFPDHAWQKVQIDFHILPNGHELMSIIDLFSSFPIVVEVPTTAHHYVLPKMDSIFSLMGFPEDIRSDNGPPFQGRQFKEFCEKFGIHHTKTTPEWPQANGKIENFNKNLRKLIQKSFIGIKNWNSELNSFLRAYRNAPQCSSLVAPAELIFIKSNSSKLPLKVNDSRNNSEIQKFAKKNDQAAKEKMKRYADRRRKAVDHHFSVGDKVLFNQLHNKKIFNKIKSKAGNEIFEIRAIKGSMVSVFNGDKEFSRNVSLFKRAPTEMENISDELPESFITDNIEAHVSAEPNNINNNSLNLEDVDEVAAPEQRITRVSTRVKRPINHFVAEPASGLINRAPKKK